MNELNNYIVQELGEKYFNQILNMKSNFFATEAYYKISDRYKKMDTIEAIATKWHLISFGMDLVDELKCLVNVTKMKKNKLSVLIPLIFILDSKLDIKSGVDELTKYYDEINKTQNEFSKKIKN